MKKWTVSVCAIVAALSLAACSSPQDGKESTAPVTGTGAAKKASVPRPAANADDNSWGLYLADQGKVHADDIGMKPFIYVIPVADNDMADERRKNEADSIVQGAGSVLIPGALLILGGPDANVTRAFVEGLGKNLKPDSLKGVTVLVVGDGSQKELLSKTLAASGARVRVASM